MSEQARLTDEQVAEALKLAQGVEEFERLHHYDPNSIASMSILSLSRALLQVSADLSEAREELRDVTERQQMGARKAMKITRDIDAALGVTSEQRHAEIENGAGSVGAVALLLKRYAALQEAARGAVAIFDRGGTRGEWHAVISSLRSLLEGEK